MVKKKPPHLQKYVVFFILFFLLCGISFQAVLVSPLTIDIYQLYVRESVAEPYPLSMSSKTAKMHAGKYVGYVTGDNEKLSAVFSEKEMQHAKDVRELYGAIKTTFFLITSTALLYVLLLRNNCSVSISKWLNKNKRSSKKSLVIIYVTIVTQLFFFKPLFYFLHRVFFTNDLWLLPYTSVTIQTFPQSFFIYFFILAILINTLLYCFITQIAPGVGQRQ